MKTNKSFSSRLRNKLALGADTIVVTNGYGRKTPQFYAKLIKAVTVNDVHEKYALGTVHIQTEHWAIHFQKPHYFKNLHKFNFKGVWEYCK